MTHPSLFAYVLMISACINLLLSYKLIYCLYIHLIVKCYQNDFPVSDFSLDSKAESVSDSESNSKSNSAAGTAYALFAHNNKRAQTVCPSPCPEGVDCNLCLRRLQKTKCLSQV